MNWFTSIFKGQNKTNSNTPSSLSANTGNPRTVEIPNVTEDLFVENKPPVNELETSHPSGINIQAFLAKDYYGNGFQDGYNYHNLEMLTNRLKSIKAEFRLQVDLVIDQRRRNMLELRTHNIEMEGLSERTVRQIEAVENDYRAMVERLEKEKELSAVDEGWVMKPVHDYRDAFLRGVERYNEEKLLAVSTGLFN
jgi:hypothetical protein